MTTTEAGEFGGERPKVSERLYEKGFTTRRVSADDEQLWLKMGKLRALSYVHDKRYLAPEVLDQNGAEYDLFDDQAEHFVALDDKENVIGTIRVIGRGEETPFLSSEEQFGVQLPSDAREISRFITHPDVPARLSPVVSLALMRAALQVTSKSSDTVYAVLEDSLHTYLGGKIGIDLETVADPQWVEKYNTVNHLVSMTPKRITAQIHERDRAPRPPFLPSRLAPFFQTYASNEGLGHVDFREVAVPSPEQFDRNLGFINELEHTVLSHSTVAIAGAGGDGGELAVTLAQLGVGRFRIADPEVFEVNNLNRQAGASYRTIGLNKAEVIADMIRDINPYAEVEVFPAGINQDNLDDFMAGARLVIDETEYTQHELGVMIARKAREHKLPVLMTLNVGFGAYTTSFTPDGMSFEKYLGLDESMPIEEIAKQEVPLNKWIVHVPSYADISLFAKVDAGTIPTPTVSTGVKMAAADASMQALSHLLKDITPQRAEHIVVAPRGKSIDAIDGVHYVNFPKVHFYKSVAVSALRTRLGLNPRAGSFSL